MTRQPEEFQISKQAEISQSARETDLRENKGPMAEAFKLLVTLLKDSLPGRGQDWPQKRKGWSRNGGI
jgi:hypothetical protein